MTRRRLVAWAVVIAGLPLASWLLAHRLASQDPIGEVLLGRAGSTLPLLVLVLVLRLTVLIVLPALVAMKIAGVLLRMRR